MLIREIGDRVGRNLHFYARPDLEFHYGIDLLARGTRATRGFRGLGRRAPAARKQLMFRYVTSSFLDGVRIKHPEGTVLFASARRERRCVAIPTAAVASGPPGGAEARGTRRRFRYGERKRSRVSCQNIRDELRRWMRKSNLTAERGRSRSVGRLRHSVGRDDAIDDRATREE